MMELCAVRSDLTLVELPLSVLEGLVGGFRGNVGGEEDAGS